MRELARELLAGEEAWIVGGAVRDELLGRPVLDLDIATREPERAARAYANEAGGAPFPLSARGYRRLAELGLLAALGGALDHRLERVDSAEYRLVCAFRDGVERWPISNETKRYARALLRAEPPDRAMRSIHRFRLQAEPW